MGDFSGRHRVAVWKQENWMALSELGEKDRAFLWQHGLMLVEGIWDEVRSWGDEISYPKRDESLRG